MEDEQEQSEHQAENQDEAESHTEDEEALSADVLDNQSLKDIVRANILFVFSFPFWWRKLDFLCTNKNLIVN